LPKVCSGKPIYLRRLFLSLVRNEVGLLAVFVRKSKDGSPASARFNRRPDVILPVFFSEPNDIPRREIYVPGISDIKEY
jgi:hypothetical protein